MKAYYIRTVQGLDLWRIIGNGQDFTTYFSCGTSKDMIEEYYND